MRVFAIEDKNVQRFFNLFRERKTGKMDVRYFPGVVQSIQRATNVVHKEWISLLNKQEKKKGWCRQYAETIGYELRNQGMVGYVYADDKNMYVRFIENGIPRFDMKNPPNGRGLLNSPRTRMGKHGKYNIVPFRHGSPGAQHMRNLPIAVYEKAKNLNKGDIAKRYRTIGIGETLTLKGGSEKKRIHSRSRGLKGKRGGSIYEGLLRAGSPRHTSYVTFRVISRRSTGWIYPGSPPMNIFSTVEKKVSPIVNKIMKEGFKADIEMGLQYMKRG
jgi:hypothetical protein